MIRHRVWMTALAGLCAALSACGAHAPSTTATGGSRAAPVSAPIAGSDRVAAPGADWPTFNFDAQRSGVGPARTGITGRNARALRARVVHIDGVVDSAPIELHAVRAGRRVRDAIFVTTSYGRTIAIDAGTGHRVWEYTPRDLRAYDRTAYVTDTTPVADPDRRYIYAVTPDGLVHKLSVATGREVRGHWPVRITYDPTREKMDSPLGVSGASVIATTGGYTGDRATYQGHVVLIDRASGRITHVFNTLCSQFHRVIVPRTCPHSDSAVWSRAGVVVEPGSGRLLLTTGNGDFDGRTLWGDSVLELSPKLALLHNWTPTDQASLNGSDTDLGSSSPVLLPVLGGRRLLVQGGKDARMRLLDLDRLDGTRHGAGPRLGGELQEVATPGAGELLTAPAVWGHDGRAWVFAADDSGTTAYVVSGGRRPRIRVAWENPVPGTSPVLAGGLLYVYDHRDGALDIYSPVSGARIAQLGAAAGHWNSPIVAGGRVILPVGTYHSHSDSGEIFIYHL